MKAMRSISADPNTASTLVKIATLFFLFLSLIFLSKLFSDSYQHHLFAFSPSTTTAVNATSVSVGPPNAIFSSNPQPILITPSPPPLPSRNLRSPPPPPLAVERTGIVDENGFMTDDFVVGEFDPAIIVSVANASVNEGRETGDDDDQRRKIRVKLRKFEVCDESKRDYVPCLDNAEAVSRLNSTDRGEKHERHCPEKGKGLNCLVPRPKGYKLKIPWPQSRDEVWFTNVPHTHLAEDKGGKNWISRKKDKFIFPGSETPLIHRTDEYLDQISKMVPDIEFGLHTHVALDVGCGVASFGAFLVNRNVTTLSIAPKDVHENLIQFALERGVPAIVAVFGTQRLFYPSQAFDLIHCSRCRINWTHDDGILLLEVNRMLRPGRYFVWAPEPIYEHEDNMQEQWKEMEDFTERICWELVKKEGYISIWRKPLNHSCYLNRQPEVHPPLCEVNDDPDDVWYVNLKKCITQLPENGYGANLTTWPARLHSPPDRLFTIKMDAYTSRKEIFRADSKYWNDIVSGYVGAFHWKKLNLRNVMDMRARYGGFAAALQDYGLDCWVMNVVPVGGSNTLPVIYDRGLIGVMHDWCEPFDTYPRTYDLLNAAGLFSVEQKRCNISTIMLEMDRILRPGGHVYIRDTLIVIEELQEIAAALGWVTFLFDTGEGPHASWKLLLGEKRL